MTRATAQEVPKKVQMSDRDELLFSDMPDLEEGFEFSAQTSDREVLHAIWSRHAVGDIQADEGWATLYERYPDEPRFLLLNAYTELLAPEVHGAWDTDYFLVKLNKIFEQGGAGLAPALQDLVKVGFRRVLQDDTKGAQRRATAFASKLGIALDEDLEDKAIEEAELRLSHLETGLIHKLHARTAGNAPAGQVKEKARPSATDHARLLTKAHGPKKPYSPKLKLTMGEAIEHATFGVGVVTALSGSRATVLFRDGERKLACAAR